MNISDVWGIWMKLPTFFSNSKICSNTSLDHHTLFFLACSAFQKRDGSFKGSPDIQPTQTLPVSRVSSLASSQGHRNIFDKRSQLLLRFKLKNIYGIAKLLDSKLPVLKYVVSAIIQHHDMSMHQMVLQNMPVNCKTCQPFFMLPRSYLSLVESNYLYECHFRSDRSIPSCIQRSLGHWFMLTVTSDFIPDKMWDIMRQHLLPMGSNKKSKHLNSKPKYHNK